MESKEIFDRRITFGNMITMIMILVGGFWAFADNEAKDRVQDEQIRNSSSMLERLIMVETTARKEALQDLRLRVDADRAEMRQQFAKLNDKIDELIKQGK